MSSNESTPESTLPGQPNSIPRVAYLGPPGTFTQQAVVQYFGEAVNYIECGSIDDVFQLARDGGADFGVVPVENSTEGAVNNTLDCLLDNGVQIVGEVVIPIVQHLMIKPGASEASVKTIVSHKQSLAQCRSFLQVNFPNIELQECTSNAAAAEMASHDPSLAAIAGQSAATHFDLEIIRSSIQDKENNRTRFLVLGLTGTSITGTDKTSIVAYAENKPGALFRLLEPFEKFGVSLTRLESRPSRQAAWEYVFFMDFEGHSRDPEIGRLLEALQASSAKIVLLGSYALAPAVDR